METVAPPPPLPVNSADKILAILCHVSPFISVPFLLPFIVWLAKRDDSSYVADHAKEALNFHLSLLLYGICALPLAFVLVGFFIWGALAIIMVICALIAAIRAGDGGFYRYPLTIRFF